MIRVLALTTVAEEICTMQSSMSQVEAKMERHKDPIQHDVECIEAYDHIGPQPEMEMLQMGMGTNLSEDLIPQNLVEQINTMQIEKDTSELLQEFIKFYGESESFRTDFDLAADTFCSNDNGCLNDFIQVMKGSSQSQSDDATNKVIYMFKEAFNVRVASDNDRNENLRRLQVLNLMLIQVDKHNEAGSVIAHLKQQKSKDAAISSFSESLDDVEVPIENLGGEEALVLGIQQNSVLGNLQYQQQEFPIESELEIHIVEKSSRANLKMQSAIDNRSNTSVSSEQKSPSAQLKQKPQQNLLLKNRTAIDRHMQPKYEGNASGEEVKKRDAKAFVKQVFRIEKFKQLADTGSAEKPVFRIEKFKQLADTGSAEKPTTNPLIKLNSHEKKSPIPGIGFYCNLRAGDKKYPCVQCQWKVQSHPDHPFSEKNKSQKGTFTALSPHGSPQIRAALMKALQWRKLMLAPRDAPSNDEQIIIDMIPYALDQVVTA